MDKKAVAGVLASLFTAGLVLATSVGAQSTAATSNLGQSVKACNMTYKDGVKAVQADFKDKKITKTERTGKLKDLNQTRLACVKDAQVKARDEAKKMAEEQKAKRMEAQKARQEEAKKRAEEQKAKAKEAGAKKATKPVQGK